MTLAMVSCEDILLSKALYFLKETLKIGRISLPSLSEGVF